MIANLGPIAWVMILMLFASHMQCLNGTGFHVDIADVLTMVGVSGIMMIGIFELNHFDNGMKLFHYVGVGMAICILVARYVYSVYCAHIMKTSGFVIVTSYNHIHFV